MIWTPEEITRARDAHPVLRDILYLNTGTKGLTAKPVVERMNDLACQVELGGYPGYRDVMHLAELARLRLARLLNAGETELAFTGNASYSLNIALCLHWETWQTAPGRPVDVLISDHEYPTTYMVFHHLEQLGKIRLIRYVLSADTDELLASLNTHVTDETRLVVASHVCCNTGLRANVTAIAKWCRERNIVSYIDGAQAVGQFPIDLTAIGCDLYITNAHKWLYGPNGVGLLYVRSGVEEFLIPPNVASGTIDFHHGHGPSEPTKWRPGAQRFEPRATRPAQVFAAVDEAMNWLQSFGPGAIEARQRALTEYVKARILEMPDRFRLITPLAWEQSSALATLQIRGRTGAEIAEFCGRMLTENKAWLRSVPEFDGLRLAMAYYNTESEYEQFFDLLRAKRIG